MLEKDRDGAAESLKHKHCLRTVQNCDRLKRVNSSKALGAVIIVWNYRESSALKLVLGCSRKELHNEVVIIIRVVLSHNAEAKNDFTQSRWLSKPMAKSGFDYFFNLVKFNKP